MMDARDDDAAFTIAFVLVLIPEVATASALFVLVLILEVADANAESVCVFTVDAIPPVALSV